MNMEKILFVKDEFCTYSDEDVLNLYKCINKIKKGKKMEYHYCADNYLVDCLIKSDKNKIKKIAVFKNKINVEIAMKYLKENNIKNLIIMGMSNNYVLLYKMYSFVNKIKIYSI